MYYRRKEANNDSGCCAAASTTTTTTTMGGCCPSLKSSKLFQPGVKLIVRRAPIISGVISAGLCKKFQRPMLKRRAYGKDADAALKQCTLGPRKRMNGMAKIMSRAGKGLSYKGPNGGAADANEKNGNDESGSSGNEDDDEKEEDRPFEPLCLWISPHQEASSSTSSTTAEDEEKEGEGGNASSSSSVLLNKGLPPRVATITRDDEYGVQEQVQVLQPAPLSAYAKDNVLVSPVLAKWLRPHQREGVQFMYECVMGLRGFKGNGWYVCRDIYTDTFVCAFFGILVVCYC
jgi:hypothetical protein